MILRQKQFVESFNSYLYRDLGCWVHFWRVRSFIASERWCVRVFFCFRCFGSLVTIHQPGTSPNTIKKKKHLLQITSLWNFRIVSGWRHDCHDTVGGRRESKQMQRTHSRKLIQPICMGQKSCTSWYGGSQIFHFWTWVFLSTGTDTCKHKIYRS